MKVPDENKHFTFKIKWKNIDGVEEKEKKKKSRKLMKDLLIDIGWAASEDDLSYTELIVFNCSNDGICEATVNDKQQIKTNLERSEELLSALWKDVNVEAVRLLSTNDDAEGIILNSCDKVPLPFHEYYKGKGEFTLIFHDIQRVDKK